MSVIDPASAERLSKTPLAWLTTVSAGGQPQSSYVWFHWDGENIVLLSKPNAGKVHNLGIHPKVSFHLDGDGSEGSGVLTIDATAEVLGDRLPDERKAAYLAKYDHLIRAGLKSTPEEVTAEYSVAIEVVPKRLRAW